MKRAIIVVEDETDVANLVRLNLESAGYLVKCFHRSEPAFVEAIKNYPSLFLLDILLPEVDGLELCRRIRKTEQLKSPVPTKAQRAGYKMVPPKGSLNSRQGF